MRSTSSAFQDKEESATSGLFHNQQTLPCAKVLVCWDLHSDSKCTKDYFVGEVYTFVAAMLHCVKEKQWQE